MAGLATLSLRIARAIISPKIPAQTLDTHDGYASPGPAKIAAGAHGSVIRRPIDGRYIPVVVLRLDQRWMRERFEERGLVVLDAAQQAEIIRVAGL